MGERATLSDRALIGFRAFTPSFVKNGTRPHLATSRRLSLVCGSSRTMGASFVGAMFQVGSRLGSGPVVSKMVARSSAGRMLAYRPHMLAHVGLPHQLFIE